MIPFAEVIDKPILSRLDANGSDAYDLNLDRIRAVNGAQYQIVSAVNSIMERTKMVGEAFVDLNKTAVFQSTEGGQVSIDALLASNPLNQELWTILAVYPEFASYGPQVINTDLIPDNSTARFDIKFIKGLKSAKHYTQEQDADVNKDVFAPGSPMASAFPANDEWGYRYGSEAFSVGGVAPTKRLTLLGPIAFTERKLVAVSYLKVPTLVPEMPQGELDPLYASTQLEWPPSMAELLITVALRILAIKTGDGTTQYGLSSQEMGMLIQAIA